MIRVFLIEQIIDGHMYSGEICARDWNQAEALAGAMGARVMGEAQGTVCAKCGAVEIVESPYDPTFFDNSTVIDA